MPEKEATARIKIKALLQAAGWCFFPDTKGPAYIQANKLRFLRKYQLQTISKLQEAVGEGKNRFLCEMATGTGKTLTAAAVEIPHPDARVCEGLRVAEPIRGVRV